MDILDDMGVSKLSAKVFSKVNYSFKQQWHFGDWKRKLLKTSFKVKILPRRQRNSVKDRKW